MKNLTASLNIESAAWPGVAIWPVSYGNTMLMVINGVSAWRNMWRRNNRRVAIESV